MGTAAGQARLSPLPEQREGAEQTARSYARRLLGSLGVTRVQALDLADEHPALTWARSGLMTLTGRPDGPPLMCPVPLAACADGVLAALASLAPPGSFDGLRGSELLAERAAITGHSRRGSISPGGCHLLECADGWLAINLAREEDWQMVPAWIEQELTLSWDALAEVLRTRSAVGLARRAREMGLAIAPDSLAQESPPWMQSQPAFPRKEDPRVRGDDKKGRAPLVVDLSSLWAGPLCSHLLQRCGAEVIKLESLQRPDGARHGHFAFFDLLNAGKQNVVLDFGTAEGRAQLRALLSRADIVIEGTRPRALRQLGIDADALIRENPRLTWISITGYGRAPERENWIAYGDDAGVAAGLSQIIFKATGEHLFVGDAIADPLTGIHAALAAWMSFRQGGGRLIALPLVDVVRHCIGFDLPQSEDALRHRQSEWTALAEGEVANPRTCRAPLPVS